MTAISFVIALAYAIRYFVGDILVIGYTSLIISIWFLTGVIISLLGLVGLYIGKMFDTVKNRPTYIVGQSINC